MKSRNLRYYLRGLGIGICVSVLIVGVTQRNQKTMTDEQVRERAGELGLVDSSGLVLADLQKDTPDSGVAEDNAGAENPSGNADMEMTQETAAGETLAETQVDETQVMETDEQLGEDGTQNGSIGQTVADQTQTGNDGQDDSQNTEIIFEIKRGSDSYRVSKDLESAGLIENAKAFDKYLCDEGYSKTIRSGVYTIKSGESEAVIAKIITGKR